MFLAGFACFFDAFTVSEIQQDVWTFQILDIQSFVIEIFWCNDRQAMSYIKWSFKVMNEFLSFAEFQEENDDIC